jgi:hypothetical protein
MPSRGSSFTNPRTSPRHEQFALRSQVAAAPQSPKSRHSAKISTAPKFLPSAAWNITLVTDYKSLMTTRTLANALLQGPPGANSCIWCITCCHTIRIIRQAGRRFRLAYFWNWCTNRYGSFTQSFAYANQASNRHGSAGPCRPGIYSPCPSPSGRCFTSNRLGHLLVKAHSRAPGNRGKAGVRTEPYGRRPANRILGFASTPWIAKVSSRIYDVNSQTRNERQYAKHPTHSPSSPSGAAAALAGRRPSRRSLHPGNRLERILDSRRRAHYPGSGCLRKGTGQIPANCPAARVHVIASTDTSCRQSWPSQKLGHFFCP